MPIYKIISNKFLNFIEESIFKFNFLEYHSGFRGYSCEALKKIPLENLSDTHLITAEILALAKIRKLKVKDFPIDTIYNTNSSSTTVGNLFPNTTGSDLGHPFGNGEWDRLYIQNNPNVSSDERKKENIEDLSYGLDYINTLSPKSYTLISDENSKVHWGFIAQQLLETPPEPDLDIAFVDYQEEHDHYSVAYAELIAPLVKGIQELSTKVDDLTARIEALEG